MCETGLLAEKGLPAIKQLFVLLIWSILRSRNCKGGSDPKTVSESHRHGYSLLCYLKQLQQLPWQCLYCKQFNCKVSSETPKTTCKPEVHLIVALELPIEFALYLELCICSFLSVAYPSRDKSCKLKIVTLQRLSAS